MSPPSRSGWRRWRWTVIAALVIAGLAAGGAFYLASGPQSSTGRGEPTASTELPSTTVLGRTFLFTTQGGDQMAVAYRGTRLPSSSDCIQGGSPPSFYSTCATARSDNLVEFSFVVTDVGKQTVTSFTPYEVFLTLNTSSGSTSDQQIGFPPMNNTFFPRHGITITSKVEDIVSGSRVTSVVLVPDSSSAVPYPTWPVNVVGSDSWCSQEQNPPPCQVAYLGVGVENVGQFVEIQSVVSGSPASVAGLRTGDLITALDGIPVTDAASFSSAIRADHVDQVVYLTIISDEHQTTVTTRLALAPGSVPPSGS